MTPLDVVVRILNNQLSSLMWIDEKVCIHCIYHQLRYSIHDAEYLLALSS